MNKKLLALLDSINEKKTLIKSLVDEGKIEDAKNAKKELVELQDKFDILKDMSDEPIEIKDKKKLNDPSKATPEQAFANAARMKFTNLMKEGSDPDGGYTVPEDIQTKINEYRTAEFSLEDIVTVEQVKTDSGERTYQKKSQIAGFTAVGEGGKLQGMDTPQFERLSYTIKKYGGWLPVTNELFADTDANITAVLTKWIANQSRVTRNKLILGAIATAKENIYEVFDSLDDILEAVNVTLGAAYKAGAKIITNDYGLQELATFKDGNGRSLIQPVISEPKKMQLCCGNVVIPVEVLPVSDMPNVADGGKEYAPVIVGDLKEAVTLFDRQKTKLKTSDTAAVTGFNAFEEDLTLFRAIEREDVQVKDAGAVVFARFSTEHGTVTAA